MISVVETACGPSILILLLFFFSQEIADQVRNDTQPYEIAITRIIFTQIIVE